MSFLDVPGARLAYETHGSGPLLLLIPGAFGSGAVFRPLIDHLANGNTVVTYDRRGFARSQLAGPQDEAHRLEADADDARRLLAHLSNEPAIVFGTSSGAVVALELLTRHPSVVRTLLPFEPPAMRLLPDGRQWIDFFFQVYERYRESGIEPALAMFRERTFAETDRQAMSRARDPKASEAMHANVVYWFEHELRQYPAVALDLNALKAHAGRIVPMAGQESRGYPCYGVSVELGKHLGREVTELPGGHVGFVAQPAAFEAALNGLLG